MDADKKWLTTSAADEDEIDPFENTDAGNLATLSGRDPFNSDFLVNSSSKPASVEQHDAAVSMHPSFVFAYYFGIEAAAFFLI